ncbi:zinc finger protein ZFP1 [Besnoitia besnoiti]|uniref:Zinc finger protein ZFP1 n=1 Tax=Besnoitia besnoiti TaxID=94643 RepID=A0A2A9MMU5_BESBE|nr:zinc finger protein ZFP1 [Besnoitia besnoiti]PFH37466.1 zinc finger protein ZFP1 [Besnoitia besnoiti]
MEPRVKRSNRTRLRNGGASASSPASCAAASAQQSNLTRKIFWKTQLCPKFQATGVCPRKEHCSFAHSKEELRTPPDLRCTKWCRRVFRGQVCDTPECPYAHSKDDLRCNGHQLLTFKTAMCKFHAKGACLSGKKCRFAHTMAELRVGTDELNTNSEDSRTHATRRGSLISTRSEASAADSGESPPVNDLVASGLRAALASLEKTARANSKGPAPRCEQEDVHRGGADVVSATQGSDSELHARPAQRRPRHVSKPHPSGGAHLVPSSRGAPREEPHHGSDTEGRERPAKCCGAAREADQPAAGTQLKNTPVRESSLKKAEREALRVWQVKPCGTDHSSEDANGDKAHGGARRDSLEGCRGRRANTPVAVSKMTFLAYKQAMEKARKKGAGHSQRGLPDVRIAAVLREDDASDCPDSPRATTPSEGDVAPALQVCSPDDFMDSLDAHSVQDMTAASGSDCSLSNLNSSLNPEAAPFVPSLFPGASNPRLGAQRGSCEPPPLGATGGDSRGLPSRVPLETSSGFASQGARASPVVSSLASLGNLSPGELVRFRQETLTALSGGGSPEGQRFLQSFLREFGEAAAALGPSHVGSAGASGAARVAGSAGVDSALFPGIQTSVGGERGESKGAAALVALLAVSRLLSPPAVPHSAIPPPPVPPPPINPPGVAHLYHSCSSLSSLAGGSTHLRHAEAPEQLPAASATRTEQEKTDANPNAIFTLAAALLAMAPHLAKHGTAAPVPPSSAPAMRLPQAQGADWYPPEGATWTGHRLPAVAPTPAAPAAHDYPAFRDYLAAQAHHFQQAQSCAAPSLAEATRSVVASLPRFLRLGGAGDSGSLASAPLAAVSGLHAPYATGGPSSLHHLEQLRQYLNLPRASAHRAEADDSSDAGSNPSSFSYADSSLSGLSSVPWPLGPRTQSFFSSSVGSPKSYEETAAGGGEGEGRRGSEVSFCGDLKSSLLSRKSVGEHVKGPRARSAAERVPLEEFLRQATAEEREPEGRSSVTADELAEFFASVASLGLSAKHGTGAGKPKGGGSVEGATKGDFDRCSSLLTTVTTTEPGPPLVTCGSSGSSEDLLSALRGADFTDNGSLFFAEERDGGDIPTGGAGYQCPAEHDGQGPERCPRNRGLWAAFVGQMAGRLAELPKEEKGSAFSLSSRQEIDFCVSGSRALDQEV